MMHRLLPAAFLAAAATVVSVGIASAQPAHFPNCKAAAAAGQEDIPSSSPYYGPWLDRDSDGVGCES